MRFLPYYILHTFINSIKKLLKTWVAVFLAFCVGFGIIGGIIGVVVGTAVDENMPSTYEETVVEEEYEEVPLTAEEKQEMLSFIRGIIILLSFAIIMFSIYGGDKSGAKIFTMPDVNFLFAAPVKPQSVLMFRTVLQMGIAIASSLYILFQIPNLVFNVGLSIFTCVTIFIAYAFLLYFSRLAAVFTYTVASTNEKLKKYIRPFVILVFAVVIGLIYILISSDLEGGYFKSAVSLLASDKWEYLLIFGWISGLIMSAANGNIIGFLIYFLALIAASVLLTALIWKIKADFYEDAFSEATAAQVILDAAQNGETVKRKKDRSEKLSRNKGFKSDGAAIFFEKTIYNRKRFAKLGIFTPAAFTYSSIALFATFGFELIFDTQSILPLGFIMLVVIFFRNMGNPLADEMSHNFIYTVPDSASKKIWYSLFGCVCEAILDILPVIIITAIAMPNKIGTMLIWALLWVSLDFFCSAVGLFTELALPSALPTSINAMFALFIRIFAIVPGLITVIIGAVSNLPIWLILTVIINIAVGTGLNFISPLFLHSGKK